MSEDDRELVCHLMARMTAQAEDAVDLTVSGQSRIHSRQDYVDLARRIAIAGNQIAILARAAELLASRPTGELEAGSP